MTRDMCCGERSLIVLQAERRPEGDATFPDHGRLGLWIETESNWADHPSRFRPLPPPRSPSGWLAAYGVRGPIQFCGVEVFAGSSRIIIGLRSARLSMLDPIDLRWGRDAFDCWLDQLIRSRRI